MGGPVGYEKDIAKKLLHVFAIFFNAISILYIRFAHFANRRLFRTSVTLKVLGVQIARLRASASATEVAIAGTP